MPAPYVGKWHFIWNFPTFLRVYLVFREYICEIPVPSKKMVLLLCKTLVTCSWFGVFILKILMIGLIDFWVQSYFSVFLELKWYRTWKLYLIFVLMYAAFLVSFAGFTLLHLGKIYDGIEEKIKYDFQVRPNDYFVLEVIHKPRGPFYNRSII